MILPELRLLEAAIAVAQDLNFSRAAERLHIDQSAVTKRINSLENQLGFKLFERNHQSVELTGPGRRFVEQAREAVSHIERAVSSAHAAFRGAEDTLNIGTTASADPFLVSTLMTVRLPLYPRLKLKFWSDYPGELVHDLLAGTLDLAIVTDLPENPKLSCLGLAGYPYYVAMLSDDSLAGRKEIRMKDLNNRSWAVLSRRVSPYSYDLIQSAASGAGVTASDVHHVTTPEQAMSFVLFHESLALLDRTGAWRVAQNGITMRPLAESNLQFSTGLAVCSDNNSRLVKEFVLRGLAKRSRAISLSDSRIDHAATCPNCMSRIVALRSEKSGRNRKLAYVLVAVTCVVIAVAIFGWFHFRPNRQQTVALVQPVSRTIYLWNVSTNRGEQPGQLQSVELPAAVVRLTVILPRFSPSGQYLIAVTRKEDGTGVVAEALAPTATTGQQEKVSIALDLRNVNAGAYFLSTTHEQHQAAYYYPLQIK